MVIEFQHYPCAPLPLIILMKLHLARFFSFLSDSHEYMAGPLMETAQISFHAPGTGTG